MGEVELNKSKIAHPINWMSYILLLIFGIWLFLLLSDSLFSKEFEIKQELATQNESIDINESIKYPLLKEGALVKKGESIGILVSQDNWETVNGIEALVNGEINSTELRNRIIGLRSGIDTIDNQLDRIQNDLQSEIRKANLDGAIEEHEEISLQKIDNTKKIAEAEKEQKEIQIKYAKKKATIEALLAASNRVKVLREENGKTIPVKRIIKKENIEVSDEAILELNEGTKNKIAELLNIISNWKTQQLVYAPASGKFLYPKSNSMDKYKIKVTNSNPIYYFNGFAGPTVDSIKGKIELPGDQSFPVLALKVKQPNQYIVIDQNATLTDQFKYNSNARIVFKQTGHSYYTMVKNLLYHK